MSRFPASQTAGAEDHSSFAETIGVSFVGPAVILTGAFIASRVVGLARDVAITAEFGTSLDYDLWAAAFRLPDTIFNLLAGGALGSALIPVFARTLAESKRTALWRLSSAVGSLIVLVSGLAALALVVFAPRLTVIFPGFTGAEAERLVGLVRILALSPVLFALGEVTRRSLNTLQHFLAPALGLVLYNAAILVAALTVARGDSGVSGLAVGAVIGAGLYVLIQVPALIARDARYTPRLGLRDTDVLDIVRLMGPRLIGQGVVHLNILLTASIASVLPDGRLSALNYAWQLMMLPLGIFGMSLADAIFPTFASLAARGRSEVLGRTSGQMLGLVLFLTVPAAVGLAIAGRPFVTTLYERGAFSAESTALTAAALSWYALGLPAHAALEILTRSFFALHDTRTPVVVGVIAMVSYVALALLLVGRLEHVALALALSLVTTVEAAVLFVLLQRRLPGLASNDLLKSVLRTALAAGSLVIVLMIVAGVGGILPPSETAPLATLVRRVGHTLALAGLGALVYGLVAWLLGAPELALVRARLPGKRRH
ncbi:MAG: murein biosynthesis integral membrane protein MurJ [Dehalococcoidia bacterium]|nr:murein biosynthesis integral membrane protein MurJ [Dehalococcoidia bacterium]